MAQRIFQVRLSQKSKSRYSAKDLERLADEETENKGFEIAKYIHSKLRHYLSPSFTLPGGNHPVGAFGFARDNINIRVGKGDVSGSATAGKTVIYIEEGDDTPANRIIREGMEPTKVPIDTLRKWAVQKGMNLQSKRGDPSTTERLHKVSAYTTKSGKEVQGYIRGRNGSRKRADRALYAIQKVLQLYGTDRAPVDNNEGPNWYPLRPKNKGRFDYIQELQISENRTLSRMSMEAGRNVMNTLIENLQSGRKKGWGGRTK